MTMRIGTPTKCRAAPTEAPVGFDTPTLVKDSGSKSSSNGIAEPPGDRFVLDLIGDAYLNERA